MATTIVNGDLRDCEDVHISQVRVGDAIVCPDGCVRTICANDIKRNSFMGTSIWGDSYKIGSVPVKRVIGRK